MKNILFTTIVAISIFLLFSPFALAQGVSQYPSASPTPSKVQTTAPTEKNLSDLESKIASLAAEKHLSERRGIIGKVLEVTSTQLTLNDLNNNTRIVRVDELTKFSSDQAKGSFGVSDITKGMTLGVLGLYYKDTRITIARFIDTVTPTRRIHGVVTSTDSKNFTFMVTDDTNASQLIDVETTTKTFIYTKDKGISRAGFSKITPGESVVISGFTDLKDPSKTIASIVLLLPELTANPLIKTSITQSASQTVTPTAIKISPSQ